jgi:hypothetical protein
MANHDMIFGESRNLEHGHDHDHVHDQQSAIDHNNNLGHGENHALELGSVHEDHLGLGETHDYELPMEPIDEHEFRLAQKNDQGGDDGQTYEHYHKPSMDKKPEDRDELSLPGQNHELILSENNDQTVSGSQGFDESMDPTVVQNPEMSIGSANDMGVYQSQYIVSSTPHVIQSRKVDVNPTYELTVGQEFPDVKSCRRALRDTAIALHFEMQTIKSDKTRFTAKCASEGCPWRIHAAKLPGVPTFTIRTIHESHTCGGISHLGHQQASVQWVASSVEQTLKENPNCKPKEILEEIHRVHGITLSYKQAWRGKERIMAAMRGSFEEGYRLLPQYCAQVKRTNPGSIASVYGNPSDNCFQRLFISFQASIYGFLNACRPLLGLDRTYLKSKYLGTLLLATGFDGDGALFPLAVGVVDEESDDVVSL